MTDVGSEIAQDARELRRGVLVTYVGYALKLGLPLVLALATRAYGAERWGTFLAVQAVVVIAVRISLLGLDKGVLWAIATCPPSESLCVVVPAFCRVVLSASVATGALWFGSSLVPGFHHAQVAPLRIAALALPPYALSELLLHAAMGRRRMELQVLVRETLNPISHVVAALLLARAGTLELGLCWAFVIAHALGFVVAALGFLHLFRDAVWPAGAALDMPRGLLRYAAPLWLADTTNALALRADTLVLASLTDPMTVGIWGIVGQFANALRQVRRAYDPIVTALAARIAVQRDTQRLSATFSYAVQRVTLTQLPLFVGLLVLADVIMPLYGPDFARGALPLVVLSALFLLSGGAALAGLIVTGYGRSGLTLLNVLLGALLQLALLRWLVPPYGLLGASIAVGASLCTVNLVQMLQLRLLTGSFHYTPRTRFSLLVVLACCASTATAAWLCDSMTLGAWPTRGAALLTFALVYGVLLAHGARRGLLRSPGAGSAEREQSTASSQTLVSTL